MPPTIRPATARDVPTLHRLIRALSAFHGEEATISLERTQTLFIGGPATALLACDASGVIGYIACLPVLRLNSGTSFLDLQHLYVCEGNRSRGIGRSLIVAACDLGRAQGLTHARIGTHPDNAGAQAAYRAMGLTETGPFGPHFRIALD